MNRATELAINQRLEDKAERDPNVVKWYMSEDDAYNAAVAAFWQKQLPRDTEYWLGCQDTIDRVWDSALEGYISDNFQSELAEFIQEMADQEAEAKRDALMEAQQ